MKQEVGEREGAGLEGLRGRISRYRQGRPPRAHLPAELWLEAAGWAEKLGVSRASSALGVSYESLRRKAGKRATGSFVEFSGAQLLDAAVGDVLELSDGTGARLTIKLGGAVALDVAAVVAAFRGARR